jgi:hypothetical protein
MTGGRVEPQRDVSVVRPFALGERIAKSDSRQTACLFVAETAFAQFVCSFGEMKGDLSVNLAIEVPATERVDQPSKP